MSATRDEFPTINAWLKAQFGRRPSRFSAEQLRRKATALEQESEVYRREAQRVDLWEESRRAALYGINAADSIRSVKGAK